MAPEAKQHKPQRDKQSKATAGPSEDDRYGEGPVGTNIQARIVGVDATADGSRIKIAVGDRAVRVDMEGYVKGRHGATFHIEEVKGGIAYARVKMTPDLVRASAIDGITYVMINPIQQRSQRPKSVQRRASGHASTRDVEATAQAGVAGAGSPLPHVDVIQRAFGKHDVSGIKAQIGGPAVQATQALGASAYATGNTVAFASSPDLHTAAHEAAHVIQQQRGAVGFQGLGAADDEHERHADAVADAVVVGRSAESLLDNLSNGSQSEAIQRKTAAVHEEPDHKEPSWVRPTQHVSETPEHVGSIFFHTKNAQVDSRDRSLFQELANSYARFAKRNLGQHGKPLGVEGKVIGYADPRTSHAPSNAALSAARADSVATGLQRSLVAATNLDIGNFSLARVAAGVAPDAPTTDEPLAEGNTLAPFRRADIYLARTETDPAQPQPKPAAETIDDAVAAPDYSDVPDIGDRFRKEIEAGDLDSMKFIVSWILGDLSVSGFGSQEPTNVRVWIGQLGLEGSLEPPWWAGRAANIDAAHPRTPRSLGRSAERNARQARVAELMHDVLLLMRDNKECREYYERHAEQAMFAVDKEKDPARRNELGLPLRYLKFMYEQTIAEAERLKDELDR